MGFKQEATGLGPKTQCIRVGAHNANVDGLSRDAFQDEKEKHSGAKSSLVLNEDAEVFGGGGCEGQNPSLGLQT